MSAVPMMETSAIANVVSPKTTALARSAGNRLGAAVRVERTIPVPYSPVITRVPRTAMTNWLKVIPTVAD